MITVKSTYRYSCQVDPTQKDSPWHSAEVGFEATADTEDREGFSKALTDEAKILVFTQLGVEFDDDLNPIPVVASPPKRQTPRAKAQRQSQSTATLDTSSLPRLTIDGVTYVDYRPAKLDGKVKPRFPDFKTEDNQSSEWLESKDGDPTDFAKKLEEAGLV